MKIGIVGVTGLVGEELLEVLAERKFAVRELRGFASERSVGQRVRHAGFEVEVEATTPARLADLDVLFLSAGASVSRALRAQMPRPGPLVFDNTSAFRLDPNTPLVVPEVNPEDLGGEARWFAVANCTAILLSLALGPLERAFGLVSVGVHTYQAISGAGRRALDRLRADLGHELRGEPIPAAADGTPTLAFNVVPSIGTAEGGIGSSTGEEEKVAAEIRRILHRPDLPVSASCVRVPVLRAHAESVEVELRDRRATPEDLRRALAAASGVELCEGVTPAEVPTPRRAAGHDGILVGRVRAGALPGRHLLFLTGDQLRKGAALNAVQLAEEVLSRTA